MTEFKVGDRVRYACGDGYFEPGVGVIARIDGGWGHDSPWYEIDEVISASGVDVGKPCTGCFQPGELELLKAAGYVYDAALEEPAKPVAQLRKERPVARGCLDYFPSALLAVAELSRIGNEQHNPGQEMHWARGKSTDHADCLVRHLIDRGTLDSDGISHTVKVAWRALALLQEELEAAGAPMSRASKVVK